MSFANNRTAELWKNFMPRRKEILHTVNRFLYSVECYPDPFFFRSFDPLKPFTKWAAVEVTGTQQVPEGMETLLIPQGLYAVFLYRGKASEGEKAYRYIFSEWLPASSYVLDHRPHFALMGDHYKHDDQESEEELWIPVKHS